MTDFILDPRLATDCLVLGDMRLSRLLLMNNALLPWFTLVPRRQVFELYELGPEDQLVLLEEVNLLSRHVKRQFDSEKLNVAAIGNIVRQLHIHVVGRNSGDVCWPGVVWGLKEALPYSASEVMAIKASLRQDLPADAFRPA